MELCVVCKAECTHEDTIADEGQTFTLATGKVFICDDCSYRIWHSVQVQFDTLQR